MNPSLDPWDYDWTDEAACRSYPADWWFPERWIESRNTLRAKEICLNCPVREPCLTEGIRPSLEGIWGGLGTEARRQLRARVSAGEAVSDVVADGLKWAAKMVREPQGVG